MPAPPGSPLTELGGGGGAFPAAAPASSASLRVPPPFQAHPSTSRPPPAAPQGQRAGSSGKRAGPPALPSPPRRGSVVGTVLTEPSDTAENEREPPRPSSPTHSVQARRLPEQGGQSPEGSRAPGGSSRAPGRAVPSPLPPHLLASPPCWGRRAGSAPRRKGAGRSGRSSARGPARPPLSASAVRGPRRAGAGGAGTGRRAARI